MLSTVAIPGDNGAQSDAAIHDAVQSGVKFKKSPAGKDSIALMKSLGVDEKVAQRLIQG